MAPLPLQLAFQGHCAQEAGRVPRQVAPIRGVMSSFRGEIDDSRAKTKTAAPKLRPESGGNRNRNRKKEAKTPKDVE